MKSIRQLLLTISAGMKRRAIATTLAQGALLYSALFWLPVLLQAPRRENAVFCYGSLFLLVSLFVVVRGIVKAVLNAKTPEQLAALVEEKRPHYMDSFATAVELEALKRPLRSIEASLLEEVHARLAQEKKGLSSLFPPHGVMAFLLPLLLAGLAICLGVKSDGWSRFRGACKGIILGDSGIVIIAPEADVPLHSDYAIQVQLTRGTQEGTIYWRMADGTRESSPLNVDEKGAFFFTFYDMTQPLEYFIRTPELSSSAQGITVYAPPAYEALRIEVESPAYTKKEKQVYIEPGIIEFLEGSELSISVQTGEHIKASLEHQDGQVVDIPEIGALKISPQASETANIVLLDSEGHKAKVPLVLTMQKDLPPEIMLISPIDEADIKLNDSLRLEASVMDDYGLETLELDYSISGGEHKQLPLKTADGQKAWTFSSLWNMKDLSLEVGNVLCCQLLATDNRQPTPNACRSQLFFVTVRPEQESVQGNESRQSQKEASVADLIAESKRLLRLTWDLRGSEQSELVELSDCLATLKQEVQSRKQQMEMMAGDLGEAGRFFDMAATALQTASGIVGRGLTEEAVPPQEQALAMLVAIETAMMRNSMKSQQASQKQQDGEGKSQQQQQQSQKQQENAAEQAKEMQTIQESIEELKRLATQQNDLNAAMLNERSSKASLAGRQGKLRNAANEVKQRLASFKSTLPVSAMLNIASGDMTGAERALKNNALENAFHYGERAQMGLRKSLEYLEELLKKSVKQEMQRLSSQAKELAQQQRQAAQRSKEGNQAPGELRQQQKQIQNATSEMMKKFNDLSNNVQKLFPQASEEINQALSKASAQGLEETQSRAQKSLAYRRMGRAAEEQDKAADILDKLSSAMQQAEQSMRLYGEEELRQALRELSNQAMKLQEASKDSDVQSAREKIKQARKGASDAISKLGDAVTEELRQTSGHLGMPAQDDNETAIKTSMFQIASAVRSIINMLQEMTQAKQTQTLQRNGAPPEKYRRQVEQYFKDISQIQDTKQ